MINKTDHTRHYSVDNIGMSTQSIINQHSKRKPDDAGGRSP
jgi:hypothetical protein